MVISVAKTPGGSGMSFRRLHVAITRRRIGNERFEEVMCGVRHLLHGTIECVFIRLRWLGETAQLPDELQRGGADLTTRGWRGKVMQGLDISAHGFVVRLTVQV